MPGEVSLMSEKRSLFIRVCGEWEMVMEFEFGRWLGCLSNMATKCSPQNQLIVSSY